MTNKRHRPIRKNDLDLDLEEDAEQKELEERALQDLLRVDQMYKNDSHDDDENPFGLLQRDQNDPNVKYPALKSPYINEFAMDQGMDDGDGSEYNSEDGSSERDSNIAESENESSTNSKVSGKDPDETLLPPDQNFGRNPAQQ